MTYESFKDRREWKDIFVKEIEKALEEKKLSEKVWGLLENARLGTRNIGVDVVLSCQAG